MTDEKIFDQAIQLPSGARADFLAEACKNQREQQARIEALIAAHEQSDSLLDTEAMLSTQETTVVETYLPKTVGDFEILGELGRGGMGVVYEARQKSLKRKVALKVLSSGLGLSSRAILRFRREAEAAGKLHHTNIVPIYTTGEDRGVHYYAMELIDGPSLDAVIRDLKSETNSDGTSEEQESANELPAWVRETALYEPESLIAPRSVRNVRERDEQTSSVKSGKGYFDTIATMMAEVADALDHAHEQGVIHRDVKPSNLLLAPDGRVSINDFGLARMLEQPGMTMSGEFVGSPLYMSPEQITAGRAPLDHRTDIYSLGATLYELLTLQPPFPGESRDQVIAQVLHKDAKPPRKINRKIPVDLETICMKAIERDPDRRYQTAGKMVSDLRAYVNRHAISARRIGPTGRITRWVKRNPLVSAMCAVFIAVLLPLSYMLHRVSADQHQERLDNLLADFAVACLSEDEMSASTTLSEIENAGANRELLSLLNANYKIHFDQSSDFQEEIGILLAQADETAAFAMLLIAYYNAGMEAEYYARLEGLRKRKHPMWLDRVYKGYALIAGDPHSAVDILEEAVAEKPLAGTQLLLSLALAYKAIDTVSSKDSLAIANMALRQADAVLLNHEDSVMAHRAHLLADLAVARGHQELDDAAALGHLKSARRHAENIRGLKKTLGTWACLAFVAADDSAGLIGFYETRFDKNSDRLEPYAAARLAIAYFRENRHNEAIELCDADTSISESTRRLIRTLIISDTLSDSSDAQNYLRTFMTEYERDTSGSIDLSNSHDWFATQFLAGKLEAGKVARDLVRLSYDHPWREVNVFIASPMTETDVGEMLGKTKDSRRVRAYAYFAAALKYHVEGNRERARFYFEKCRDDRVYSWWCTSISSALLERMDSDKNWPQWIPTRENAESK